MTDPPVPPYTQVSAVPSQGVLPTRVVADPDATVKIDLTPLPKVEATEEEPYTIKCICNFSDDDGNTIYCETCDTWQHIDCFYPDNRDEAIREDFAHSCAECKPRPLNRQKAIERTLRLKNPTAQEVIDKKGKRPPPKSHKKKPKPSELQINGHNSAPENGKPGDSNDQPPSSKKPKISHRPSHSLSSHPTKRSPSYGNVRPNTGHPPSPATSPPDLPNDFQIHHYSAGFCALYNEHDVPDAHSNAFASLAIPTALSRWLREPDTMKQEVGRTHSDVFREEPLNVAEKRPKLEIKDATRHVKPDTILRWRSVKSTSAIDKDIPLIELNGEIGFQKDYCANADNLWADLSSPLPFVFFHPVLPLYIDTRKEGSLARYVRRSCKPNAQLDTYLSDGSEYHFCLVSDRHITANEQITLPWDFRLEKSVCARWLNLLGLRDDDSTGQDEPEMDDSEYVAISNWIDRILSEYGGCACELDNHCAFARFHRRYLYGKNQNRIATKKKTRKSRTHTISPTSTGHATNSRAASEGQVDDAMDVDDRGESASSRSKPPSRERTPGRQGSFDQLGILTEPTDRDKRKVAMVEDSFRRMEQQQPPKKKKRVSDGTNVSTSSKPKSRNGSAAPPGHYVDSGTSRSKSGSPASTRSPNLSNPFKASASRPESSGSRSRQISAAPRPVYCDAAVQTEPVEGEWFSGPCKQQPPRKRIISLSKRLLRNKYRVKTDYEDSKKLVLDTQAPFGSAMELHSPTEQKPYIQSSGTDAQSPTSQASGDVAMPDAAPPLPAGSASAAAGSSQVKTPDLRVQMPPVPAFDNSALTASGTTTPVSASSTSAQTPFSSGSLHNPFSHSSMMGAGMNPSPIKKKLSLSDYTKSRMNKSAGKVAGGTALLKSSLSSPEDIKVDVTMEHQGVDKSGEDLSPNSTTATTNGHL